MTTPNEADKTRQEMLEWAANLPPTWTHYVTLTFRTPQGPTSATMHLRSWLASFSSATRRSQLPLRILFCVEPHKTGNAHIHALLEMSRDPFVGHCKRCAHPADGSCKRVTCPRVDQTTGQVHMRSVIHGSCASDPLELQLNESWACHYGWARFEEYNPALKFGAVAYVLKYLLKSDVMEWGYYDEGNMP